jgi:hypothetical protein
LDLKGGFIVIDVREAATNAAVYLSTLSALPPTNVRLEEVELSEDEKYWFVTLSFAEDHWSPSQSASTKYKIFKIDAKSGKVFSMKMRTAS